jgi:predicted transposase YbfD/YdcC
LPKKTLKIIDETGNNAIVQVKDNQKFLHRATQVITKEKHPVDTDTDYTKGRGRKEKRVAEVFTNLSSFSASIKKQWGAYIKAVIKVTRTTITMNTKTKQRETRFEEAYYVSTTKTISAQDANRFIRFHWNIENRNHYVRDVTMGEDASRIRKNADRMVRMRSFALNVLRHNGEQNISRAQHENMLSLEKMLQYKGFERVGL